MPEVATAVPPEVRSRILEAFGAVEDPCSVSMRAGWSLLDLGLLVDTYMDGDELVIEVALTDPFCPFYEVLEQQIVSAVTANAGVASVRVEVSGKVAWDPSRARKGLLAAPRQDRSDAGGRGGRPQNPKGDAS